MTENNNTAIYSVTDKNQDLNNEVPLRPRRVVGGPLVEKEAGDGGPQAQGEGGGGEPQAQGEGSLSPDTQRQLKRLLCELKAKKVQLDEDQETGDMRITKTKAKGRDRTSTMCLRGRIAIRDQESEPKDEAVHEEKNAEHAEEQDLKSTYVQKQQYSSMEYKKQIEQQAHIIKMLERDLEKLSEHCEKQQYSSMVYEKQIEQQAHNIKMLERDLEKLSEHCKKQQYSSMEYEKQIEQQAHIIKMLKRDLEKLREHCKLQEETKLKHSYPMERMPRGQALIINVMNVKDMKPRTGSEIDCEKMAILFEKLHFEVTVYNDDDGLTKEEMTKKIQAFANMPEHNDADACMICLMSHGDEECVFGTDGMKISLADEVFLPFDNVHCPLLLNKPKTFFIQACRGGLQDQGVKEELKEDESDDESEAVQHPFTSDTLIFHSTQPGYCSWRSEKNGSWFIQAVDEMFTKNANLDACAISHLVNYRVSQNVSGSQERQKKDGMSQMSEFRNTLRKNLYFHPPSRDGVPL